jgi:mono/diheme cytochrome c family protein
MFGLHVALLPLSLAGLFGIHIVAMRHFGTVGPWQDEKRKEKGPFWPDQVFKDAVVGTVIFLVLVSLSVFFPPHYSGMADPLDTSYIPKPEWNFLFLYEGLKFFKGSLEPVGTVGVPTVLILILVLLPFLDRNPERNPLKRPVAMLGALILGGILIGLTIKGYLSPGFSQAPPQEKTSMNRERSEMKGLKEVFLPSPSEATQTSRDGTPPPSSQTSAGKESSSVPPAKGLPGKAAYIIGSAEEGAKLFEKNCSSCHGNEGKGGLSNPGSHEGKVPQLNPIDREIYSADARTFSENIDHYIQHGSVPPGTGPAIHMPAFGDTNTLTQQAISSIEAYVLFLNGVDRGQLITPGVAPRRFFAMVIILYGIVVLALGGLWRKRSSQ